MRSRIAMTLSLLVFLVGCLVSLLPFFNELMYLEQIKATVSEFQSDLEHRSPTVAIQQPDDMESSEYIPATYQALWSDIQEYNRQLYKSGQEGIQGLARVNGKMKIVAFDTTKTKSSFRTLPLVPPFEEILLKMKREQEENRRLCGNCYCQEYLGYIYVNEIGDIMKPNFLTAHFSAVLKENGMPHIRFHDLRHSCASLLFAQGVSLKEIQAWLGHSTIGTTANIYTHLDENNKLSSANAILSILTDK